MRQGHLVYDLAIALLRLLIRVFFRRAEIAGRERVPATGGGIVVAWHPNALLDGCLILAHFPRPITFGARHGLFRWPVLGPLLRALRVVPVYRRQDFLDGAGGEDRRRGNEQSLDALARAVAGGGFVGLFPEGDSHDNPQPSRLRTGAARVYYRALELSAPGQPPPPLLPVGLHYDRKRLFGSSVLVAFHPPIELPRDLERPPSDGETPESAQERVRRLTAILEDALGNVAHATESWDLHYAMHRARKLVRAERARRAGAGLGAPDMRERVLGFSRIWAGYAVHALRDPEGTRRLVDEVRRYDAELRALGVDDHELDGAPRLASPWLGAILGVQAVLVYLLLPPILIIGYLVNLPTAGVVWSISRVASRKKKDEASIKLLLGAVAFPLTWLVVAALVAWGHSTLTALYPSVAGSAALTGASAFLLSAAGAWVALNYHRLASQTLRALRVRLTHLRRKDALKRLLEERARLHDGLTSLGAGLPLPARADPHGRVREGAG
jgi:1-acyl-sn-glycerol-3-phosphate acyltransferase